MVKMPWSPEFKIELSVDALNVTRIGPEPATLEVHAKPLLTCDTLAQITVNPAGRVSATQPIGWPTSLTVTLTSVGTP
jgi:hypothetical protein